MAKALIKVSPESLKLEIVEIGELPIYNQDSDDKPPGCIYAIRESLKKYDGVLVCYARINRSVPAVLKERY